MSGIGRVPRRAAGGFTLIEMLVVLVIVALISGILLASFERITDIRVRLAAFLDGTDAPTLIASWFRDSVSGLLPDRKDGHDVFSGDAKRLSGLTVAALDGTPGVPVSMSWALTFDPGSRRTSLVYTNAAGHDLTVASWPGDRGELQYCDRLMKCGDRWPLDNEPAAQLPALVVRDAIRGDESWPIAAAPQAARDPLPKRPNLLGTGS